MKRIEFYRQHETEEQPVSGLLLVLIVLALVALLAVE